MARVRITIDGKVALTVEQAAERYGMLASSVRVAISREGLEPDGELDGKKKLYLQSRLDAILKARPGRGANLRGHG